MDCRTSYYDQFLCKWNLPVVNIDNGYGAGYIATQINRLAERDYYE